MGAEGIMEIKYRICNNCGKVLSEHNLLLNPDICCVKCHKEYDKFRFELEEEK